MADVGDVQSMDPHSLNETLQLSFTQNIYDPLVSRGKDMSLKPGLATKWTQTSPTVWRFELRKGVTFHDGTPFTADDVVFSLELLRDHGRPLHHQYYSKVAKTEVLDPLTVRFDFGGVADRELPMILGLMPILPRHATDVSRFEETTLAPPIGSGPYRVTAVKPGTSVTFDTAPAALAHLDSVAALRPEPMGLTEAGFARFRLHL